MAATRETTVSTLALWRRGKGDGQGQYMRARWGEGGGRDVQDLAGDDETEDGTLGEGV